MSVPEQYLPAVTATLGAGTETIVFQPAGQSPNVGSFSLAWANAGIANAVATSNTPFRYIVAEGVIYYTNTSAGTVRISISQNLTPVISSPLIAVAAATVVAVPFALQLGPFPNSNSVFSGGFYDYTVTANASGAGTALTGFGKVYAVA